MAAYLAIASLALLVAFTAWAGLEVAKVIIDDIKRRKGGR